jgi:hypothetical protein
MKKPSSITFSMRLFSLNGLCSTYENGRANIIERGRNKIEWENCCNGWEFGRVDGD